MGRTVADVPQPQSNVPRLCGSDECEEGADAGVGVVWAASEEQRSNDKREEMRKVPEDKADFISAAMDVSWTLKRNDGTQ